MRWLEREIRKGGTGQKGIQEDGDGKRASKIFVSKDEARVSKNHKVRINIWKCRAQASTRNYGAVRMWRRGWDKPGKAVCIN